ncbi:MAG: hypothetical protein Q9221_002218 [Calogaya cf. arnoldii]
METIKNAANSASETLQGKSAEAQKEADKGMRASLFLQCSHLTEKLGVAKDSNASLGDRATAAKDAAGNKMEEQKHDTKSEADKQAAKN